MVADRDLPRPEQSAGHHGPAQPRDGCRSLFHTEASSQCWPPMPASSPPGTKQPQRREGPREAASTVTSHQPRPPQPPIHSESGRTGNGGA